MLEAPHSVTAAHLTSWLLSQSAATARCATNAPPSALLFVFRVEIKVSFSHILYYFNVLGTAIPEFQKY
jgi:hypothetical protein